MQKKIIKNIFNLKIAAIICGVIPVTIIIANQLGANAERLFWLIVPCALLIVVYAFIFVIIGWINFFRRGGRGDGEP